MITILKLEAERKDVVFRMDFDETQRNGFAPLTFFAWEEHRDEIEEILSNLEAGAINLEQGHDRIKDIMGQCYDYPYPLANS